MTLKREKEELRGQKLIAELLDLFLDCLKLLH
jgi:hypothetical protein